MQNLLQTDLLLAREPEMQQSLQQSFLAANSVSRAWLHNVSQNTHSTANRKVYIKVK